MRALFLATALAALPFTAMAEDLTEAAARYCVTPLHTDVALGFGLDRAPAAMEAKLLKGKIAKIYRTDNPQVLVVAHDSGQTCEIMAIGMDIEAFGAATSGWMLDDAPFKASADSNINGDTPGGGYFAAQRGDGDFMQMFVTTHPESRFIGVTVGRVADSVHAREVLGLE